jgi:hypothetical protein
MMFTARPSRRWAYQEPGESRRRTHDQFNLATAHDRILHAGVTKFCSITRQEWDIVESRSRPYSSQRGSVH